MPLLLWLVGLLAASTSAAPVRTTDPAAAAPNTAPEPAAAPPGVAWLVQFDAHGVVDLGLLAQGDKVVAGFATETARPQPWFIRSQELTVTADRMRGTLTLAQGAGFVSAGEGKPPQKAPELPAEVLTLDLVVKQGRIAGVIETTKATDGGLLGFRRKSVEVRGTTLPEASADGARIELGVQGAGAPGLGAGFPCIVRLHLREGKVYEAKLIPRQRTEAAQSADVPDAIGQAIVQGRTLAGRLALKFQPLAKDVPPLDGQLVLEEGVIVGHYAAGKAKWVAGGATSETTFRARISRAPYARPLDGANRAYPAQGKLLEPDAALSAKAVEESLVPVRPGEPGKRPFHTTRLVHRAGREGSVSTIYAPAFAFAEVPGAAKYRLTAAGEPGGDAQSWTCELEKPWLPLAPVWRDLPFGNVRLTATALDAAGEELGRAAIPETKYPLVDGSPADYDHWRIRKFNGEPRTFPPVEVVKIRRRAPFNGPYWAPTRTVEQTALEAARHVLYDDEFANWRGLGAWAPNYTPFAGSYARACMVIARLSDDPHERREAIDLGQRIAWVNFLAHRGGVPDVYGGNIPLTIWSGFGYLDVYQVTKEERFKEAAIDLARQLCKLQDANGGWVALGVRGERRWGGGVFGPSEFRTNGGDALLYYLGRVRKELGVADFEENEARADRWVRENCLPAMTWQNVGWHSLELIPLQDSVAPHAISYCIWQLDYAPAKERDLKLVAEIARWCEDRHVDWGRGKDPKAAFPSCWGWARAAGTGIRVAGGLAYVFGRLGQETGDPLWAAKAQGLVQGIQAAQDPVLGGLPFHFKLTTADAATGGMSHHYDTTETICRILDVARMTK